MTVIKYRIRERTVYEILFYKDNEFKWVDESIYGNVRCEWGKGKATEFDNKEDCRVLIQEEIEQQIEDGTGENDNGTGKSLF
jgi:hypothetical protein